MSTLELKELSHPSGEVIKIAAGKTLDLKSQGTTTLPTGSVLQVIQSGTIARTTFTTTAAWVSTNTTLAITPISTSSKILVMLSQPLRVASSGSTARGSIRLKRGSTVVWNTLGHSEMFQWNVTSENATNNTMHYLDSPSTTSATTYSIEAYQSVSGTMILWESTRGAVITLMEIAG